MNTWAILKSSWHNQAPYKSWVRMTTRFLLCLQIGGPTSGCLDTQSSAHLKKALSGSKNFQAKWKAHLTDYKTCLGEQTVSGYPVTVT